MKKILIFICFLFLAYSQNNRQETATLIGEFYYEFNEMETTEEAMINSVLRSETVVGRDGNIRRGIPIDKLRQVLANNTHDLQVQD